MPEIGQLFTDSPERRDCPLCIREPVNQVLWDDEHFWVTYCVDHPDCPLIVSKDHRAEFIDEEIAWIEDYAMKEFPGYTIRYEARSYPDHCHAHLEPPRRAP